MHVVSLVVNHRQLHSHIDSCQTLFSVLYTTQAERYVDRKLDQAESALKRKQKKVKKWYSAFIGDENGARVNELHIFVIAFGAGVALGFASS